MRPSTSPRHIWIHLRSHMAVDLLGRADYRWSILDVPAIHARNLRACHTQEKSTADAEGNGQSQHLCANRT